MMWKPLVGMNQTVWKPLAKVKQGKQVRRPLAEAKQGQQVRRPLAETELAGAA